MFDTKHITQVATQRKSPMLLLTKTPNEMCLRLRRVAILFMYGYSASNMIHSLVYMMNNMNEYIARIIAN